MNLKSLNAVALRKLLHKELENNQALTAQIGTLEKGVENRGFSLSAIMREKDALIKKLQTAEDKVTALVLQRGADERRMREYVEDQRVADQGLALAQAKYEALIHVIGIITGKDTFQ